MSLVQKGLKTEPESQMQMRQGQQTRQMAQMRVGVSEANQEGVL